MYASEFGQDICDELNRIDPGGNYGWPEAEGLAGGDQFINPIATWSVEDASPSGIAIDAAGHVWMACLRGQRLYRIGTDGWPGWSGSTAGRWPSTPVRCRRTGCSGCCLFRRTSSVARPARAAV
jgi:hypothetical protein